MKLKIQITPNASKNEIIGWVNDSLKIKIAAPPKKGKANKELIAFLSKEWNIPRYTIEIVKGFKNRQKFLEIRTNKTLPLPRKEQISLM